MNIQKILLFGAIGVGLYLLLNKKGPAQTVQSGSGGASSMDTSEGSAETPQGQQGGQQNQTYQTPSQTQGQQDGNTGSSYGNTSGGPYSDTILTTTGEEQRPVSGVFLG